jgi:hypothetical protein
MLCKCLYVVCKGIPESSQLENLNVAIYLDYRARLRDRLMMWAEFKCLEKGSTFVNTVMTSVFYRYNVCLEQLVVSTLYREVSRLLSL